MLLNLREKHAKTWHGVGIVFTSMSMPGRRSLGCCAQSRIYVPIPQANFRYRVYDYCFGSTGMMSSASSSTGEARLLQEGGELMRNLFDPAPLCFLHGIPE